MLILKIAYCINNNSEKIEISAHDTNCKRYLSRLTCPNCGEKVDWINGRIQEKHFRHHHSSYSQDCENYCTSISVRRYIKPYEHEGLPLYLIKEFGSYSLAIGLYGLDESTIKEAQNIDLEIQIDISKSNTINRKINFEYFAPHKMSFIKIREIKQQYRIKFSEINIPFEIKEKWITSVNGIGTNGAIFYVGDNGGKKVSSSIGLKVNEEYLLFTSHNMNSNHTNGIIFELVHEINFGWLKSYYLYKFVIRKKDKETDQFCLKFDMELQYSQPEIIPIWPPCTILEHELLYKEDSNKYFVLTSDNEKDKDVYSHVLQKKMLSYKIKDNKYLVTSHVKSDDFISISKLHNQFTYSIIKRPVIQHTNIIPQIQVETSNDKEIVISTNAKIFVNHFKNDMLKEVILVKDDSSKYITIKKNENIIVLYGLDTIWSAHRQLEIQNSKDINMLDKELFEKINRCKDEQIVMPDNFKWMVLKQKEFNQSYNELMKHVKDGRVSIKLINLLRKFTY